MSKLYCATCKYYDFNTCEGVDWCRLNNEETGICGNCEREFEDLDEATEHYNTVVEEENKLYSLNCEMASKVADLEHRLSNCIEPKFKVGQIVWVSHKELDGVVKTEIESIDIEIEEDVTDITYYDIDGIGFDADDLFATEEEAKAKLEEMKK